MDFSLSETQEAIRDLARKIFGDHVTHERLLELERSKEYFDTALWQAVATGGLSSVVVPERCGGSGLGILELCLVLEEQGRAVAPVPLFATALLGALPIAKFGTPAQQDRGLRPVVDSAAVLSAALVELGNSDPVSPRVTARKDGADWRLDGVKECVPAAAQAAAVLVPARSEQGTLLLVVDPRGAGVTLEKQVVTSGEPQSRMTLTGARVAADAVLADAGSGAAAVRWLTERAMLGLSAIQLGVVQSALRDTAAYIAQRKQFGRPIATFQGVALRAADAFIDVEALRAVVLQAAWQAGEDRDAGPAIAAAKWWAATVGSRVTHTAQHLHGGIGSDIEYPVHRYFLWSKQNELLLGGPSQQAAKLGKWIASGEAARSEP
jgi:alkylation response protein AidB-like acyl-CoA dehydrogenase